MRGGLKGGEQAPVCRDFVVLDAKVDRPKGYAEPLSRFRIEESENNVYVRGGGPNWSIPVFSATPRAHSDGQRKSITGVAT
jgi:hypothetical protein